MAEAETIGRVTLAHLLVEHHLREYVVKRNPYLGNTERINFLGLVNGRWSRHSLAEGIPHSGLACCTRRYGIGCLTISIPRKWKAVDVDTLRSFNVRMEKPVCLSLPGRAYPDVQRFGTWAIITAEAGAPLMNGARS